RYMLDRVSNIVLGLDGEGHAESFADYAQWESWQAERKPGVKEPFRPASQVPGSSQSGTPRKKLSYLEAREYTGIEQRIAAAEQKLQAKQADLEDPAIASDGARLVAAHAAMEAAQKDLDALYARWA